MKSQQSDSELLEDLRLLCDDSPNQNHESALLAVETAHSVKKTVCVGQQQLTKQMLVRFHRVFEVMRSLASALETAVELI